MTGGAGFIGSHLVARLLELGDEVVVIDDLRVRPLNPVLGQLRVKSVREMDLDDLSGVETVYHLASHKSVPRSFDEPLEYLDNVDSGRHLLQLCADARVPQLFVGSTCEVYGDTGLPRIPESQGLAPLSPYAASKTALEMVSRAHQAAPNGGPAVTIVRFFNVYGPGERPDALVPRMCANALLRNELPIEGSGDQRRDFSHVSDVVRKLVELRHAAYVAVINFGSGNSKSVLEVAEILEELQTGLKVRHLPGRCNEISEFRADTSLQDRTLGGTAAPVDLVWGIRMTYEWWRDRDPDEAYRHILDEEVK
ncbi:NAD-dependent epimerase/dehydratase family protein [Streptomyces sp. NPDC088726]|uniref:NAD-dependent epimerase/dehydratase family protein n=1 Tax=Streptomyces sp. NPDC088726 TaxID=3365874 RepID=UPI00382E545A